MAIVCSAKTHARYDITFWCFVLNGYETSREELEHSTFINSLLLSIVIWWVVRETGDNVYYSLYALSLRQANPNPTIDRKRCGSHNESLTHYELCIIL